VALAVGVAIARRRRRVAGTGAANQPTLYAVGYAHLDTQWRWAYPQVIQRFLANTLKDNFPLIEKYPYYVFNFTGSRRYQLMKEFYPADYARMAGSETVSPDPRRGHRQAVPRYTSHAASAWLLGSLTRLPLRRYAPTVTVTPCATVRRPRTVYNAAERG
jgi:hypothetical protein